MNQSTNYKFNLPSDEDFYDINQQNENWNKADENLKNLEDKKVDAAGGDTAETIVSDFETSAENFPVPKAKEKAKTGWGKVKKFGEDFKAWMTGVCLLGHIVNNCVTNNPNLPLSAAQGKVLMDLYTVLNTKLSETAKQQGIPLYSSDILEAQGGGRLLYYDANSANTPYRAGITQASEGVAITVGNWSNFITSLAIPKGDTTLYLYSKSNGMVTNWKAIN